MKAKQLENWLLEKIRALHQRLRYTVLDVRRHSSPEVLAEIVDTTAGDVIFAIDKACEPMLLEFCERELYPDFEFLLVGEGLGEDGRLLFSRSSHAESTGWTIIIDPIDGTRPLMYDKRSAWILTAVAQNHQPLATLADIVLAVQTEIPTQKQACADVLWAKKSQPACAVREDLRTGTTVAYRPRPSTATHLSQGFASFVHFFHGSKEAISRIDEALRKALHGPMKQGEAWAFEDQYMSTGGQIYELATGRDRFVADLRALVGNRADGEVAMRGLCCHPYDICTALIARQAGAVITDAHGEPLQAPLDVVTDLDWVGYANPTLQQHIAPVLRDILDRELKNIAENPD